MTKIKPKDAYMIRLKNPCRLNHPDLFQQTNVTGRIQLLHLRKRYEYYILSFDKEAALNLTIENIQTTDGFLPHIITARPRYPLPGAVSITGRTDAMLRSLVPSDTVRFAYNEETDIGFLISKNDKEIGYSEHRLAELFHGAKQLLQIQT